MGDPDQQENFSRARNLLIGAVDTVLALANSSQQPSHPGSSSSRPGPSRAAGSILQQSRQQPSTSSLTPASTVSIEEHRRLFNYRSSKGKRPSSQRKGKKRSSTWKKDCICLRDKEQSWKPSSEEKIELARMGLGHKEVIFQSDGDVEHIHRSLLNAFPVLEECGGYTLLRLTENSHSMVEIEGPESGMTVAYLKDILNQAKLYVHPLQKDITEEDMKVYSIPKVMSLDE